MTSPETTDPEVLAAAREALAKLDDDKYPLSAAATRKGENDEDIHIRVAIAAINEYRRSGSGVVKALEWAGPDMHGEFYTRGNVGAQYVIRADTGSGFWLTNVGHYFQTRDEAKAAAQADYERRIRSALAEPAAGETTANANAKAALEPFVSFAEDHVEKTNDGWQWLYGSKDRIVDWFGPSDFGRLLHFAQALSTGQGGRAEALTDARFTEHRKTFTVPNGYEAVRDADGRTTGKVRKIEPAPDRAALEYELSKAKAELKGARKAAEQISHAFSIECAAHAKLRDAARIATPSDKRLIADRAALIERLETTETRLNNHIDYSIDLARIIESLCGGSGTVIRPKTTAEHHYKMAVEFAKKHSDQATNLRHWREECGKLHGKLRNAEAAIAALTPSNGGK